MHDVLDARDLVPDEAEQLVTEGYPATTLGQRARTAANAADYSALAAIGERMRSLRRDTKWPWVEPSDERSIRAAVTGVPRRAAGADVATRIHAAWAGRCVGCTMGKPVEGLTADEIAIYLKAADAWPQTGFIPLLDVLPEGVSHLHESAPSASAGRFDSVPRDDDIDWTILGLHLLETYGSQITTADIAREWLDRLPFTQTFTAERAAYRNLVHGLAAPATATTANPYREWIGALIRGDIFGYTHPGDPSRAAWLAFTDARLSHVGNGIYGEMWSAALLAAALTASTTKEALRTALGVVPTGSRLYAGLRDVLDAHDRGVSRDAVMTWFRAEYGHYNWVHTINNAILIAIGLLWGGDDLVDSVALTVAAGCDTDSVGATVGSVLGAVHGMGVVPDELASQFDDTVHSAVRDFDGISITELARRTAILAESFSRL